MMMLKKNEKGEESEESEEEESVEGDEDEEESEESEDESNKDEEEDEDTGDSEEAEETEEEETEEVDEGDEGDEEDVEEEDKPSDLEAANELLRQQIEAMAKGQPAIQPDSQSGKEEEVTEEEQEKVVVPLPEQGVEGVYTFVTEEQAEDMGIDPTIINKLGNQIYQLAVRNTLLAMPTAVKREVQTEMRQESLASEFYGANEDLTKYKSFVGIVANEMIASDPNMKPEDLFGKLGNEVRNRLGLSPNGTLKGAPKISKEGTKKRKPAFAKSRSSKQRKVEDDRTPLEADIDDIIELDERNV